MPHSHAARLKMNFKPLRLIISEIRFKFDNIPIQVSVSKLDNYLSLLYADDCTTGKNTRTTDYNRLCNYDCRTIANHQPTNNHNNYIIESCNVINTNKHTYNIMHAIVIFTPRGHDIFFFFCVGRVPQGSKTSH